MPEGPEIRRAADRIARVLVDRTVIDVELTLPSLRRYQNRLRGRRVTAIETHGKAMLSRFDNGLTLYSHNQLYGRWYVVRRPARPDTNRELRVALHTSSHSALLYSASDIEVLTERQLERHPFLSKLGPDILDASLTRAGIVERLRNPRFCNRAFGALYLDQSFLAGLGNYLRSEILWAARVHPRLRPADVDERVLGRVADRTLTISRRSYRSGGLTVTRALARRLEADGWRFGERRFYVFGREGEPCHECGRNIDRDTLGSRNIFQCATCQPPDVH